MISNIQNIKKVGCFDEFESKDNKLFDKVNIFYGNNGSGKTTFSNILYLLSKHCKDKPVLLNELIDDDSQIEILTDTGKITQKNISENNFDLYVFNSKFVTDSVYNGNTSNFDSFSHEIKLTNETINVIDAELLKVNSRKKRLENWITKIQEKLDAIWIPYNNDFQQKIPSSRLTGIKPNITDKATGNLTQLKSELSSLYFKYDNIAKQATTISRLLSFKTRLDLIQNISIDIQDAQIKLSTSISREAKGKIGEKIKKIQEQVEAKKIQDAIGDINDWYRKGGRLLHTSKELNSHCPLCDTNLSTNIDSIISDYTIYFNDAILELFEFLDQAIEILEKLIRDNFIQSNSEIAKDIVDTSKLYEITIDSLVFNDDVLLLESVQELLRELKRKKKSPDETITLKAEHIQIIERYIHAINLFKTKALLEISKEIEELKKKNIDSVIKEIKEKIKQIVSVELNESANNVFSSNRKSNSEIATKISVILGILNPIISELEINRSEEVAKLNAESKYVNIYLRHLGIHHFIVDKVKDKTQDNIVITYLKTGKKKNKFNHALSEGEKTALAFAYFISKLRVEKIEGTTTEFENCIIVIDDPISSLDDNRLFQTANLIDSFLFYNKENDAKQPKQLFILSHNLVFIKYLHNALRTNSELEKRINEYYISNHVPYIRNLPTGLKNFTNTYITKLKAVIDFKENKIEYNTVKNYLPNYIRIVLETFLAFKLALVKDSYDKLPGLSHLIRAMVKEFDKVEDIEIDGLSKGQVIERLNHLKKIADHESHGNIHKAEEFVFISENELTEFAKHTLQIINYIDGFHLKKIKGHSS